MPRRLCIKAGPGCSDGGILRWGLRLLEGRTDGWVSLAVLLRWSAESYSFRAGSSSICSRTSSFTIKP